jgi:hypothetical protein
MVQVAGLDRTIVIHSSHLSFHRLWMILVPATSLCGSIRLAVVVAALEVNFRLLALLMDVDVVNYVTRR